MICLTETINFVSYKMTNTHVHSDRLKKEKTQKLTC